MTTCPLGNQVGGFATRPLRLLEGLQERGGSGPPNCSNLSPWPSYTAPASSAGSSPQMPGVGVGVGGAAEPSLMTSGPRTVLSHTSHYSDRNSKSYKKSGKPEKPSEEARPSLALYGPELAEHRCSRAGAVTALQLLPPSPVTPGRLCSAPGNRKSKAGGPGAAPTAFQVGGRPHVLEVVHVDDVDDG